jgi:hypothetical protein
VRSSAKLLARDEAFLIAVNISKLPSVPRQILIYPVVMRRPLIEVTTEVGHLRLRWASSAQGQIFIQNVF